MACQAANAAPGFRRRHPRFSNSMPAGEFGLHDKACPGLAQQIIQVDRTAIIQCFYDFSANQLIDNLPTPCPEAL
jgi:hypothetical protein